MGAPQWWGDLVILCCREKQRREGVCCPYPINDTGGRVENTQLIERFVVNELGKMPPYLREKGDHPGEPNWLGDVLVVVAEAREKRLFIKNTGPCEDVSRCIRTDACPVLEG